MVNFQKVNMPKILVIYFWLTFWQVDVLEVDISPSIEGRQAGRHVGIEAAGRKIRTLAKVSMMEGHLGRVYKFV
jgi:hypothetical protein